MPRHSRTSNRKGVPVEADYAVDHDNGHDQDQDYVYGRHRKYGKPWTQSGCIIRKDLIRKDLHGVRYPTRRHSEGSTTIKPPKRPTKPTHNLDPKTRRGRKQRHEKLKQDARRRSEDSRSGITSIATDDDPRQSRDDEGRRSDNKADNYKFDSDALAEAILNAALAEKIEVKEIDGVHLVEKLIVAFIQKYKEVITEQLVQKGFESIDITAQPHGLLQMGFVCARANLRQRGLEMEVKMKKEADLADMKKAFELYKSQKEAGGKTSKEMMSSICETLKLKRKSIDEPREAFQNPDVGMESCVKTSVNETIPASRKLAPKLGIRWAPSFVREQQISQSPPSSGSSQSPPPSGFSQSPPSSGSSQSPPSSGSAFDFEEITRNLSRTRLASISHTAETRPQSPQKKQKLSPDDESLSGEPKGTRWVDSRSKSKMGTRGVARSIRR